MTREKIIKKFATALLAVLLPCAAAAESINIVGSSTVYPFSIAAAELFSYESDFVAPVIESTGSGGGLKLLCAGGGLSTPSITNASRRMKKSEQQKCANNNAGDILEVKIGYDGIVIAHAAGAKSVSLTRRQIFMALARQLPNGGELVDNPHQKWSDIDPALPNADIRMYGPPPTSGTRDAFVELVMEKGCAEFSELTALKKSNPKVYKAVCHAVREDGAFIEAGENDNLIIQKIASNPAAFGIFGYSFLEESRDKVRGTLIDGVAPTFETIADGSYPVSRPLFFYAKMAHYGKVLGLQEFVSFFASEDVMGEDGVLSERGLIPLSAVEYRAVQSAVSNNTPMAQL